LFWKKKNNSETLILFESNDMRSSIRVRPLSTEPIKSVFQGKPIVAENIGASGIAFRNQGFGQGDSQKIKFDLPTENTAVSVTTEIIDIDSEGICHCRFVGLSEDDFNAIHRYMLTIQIREVRKNRQVSPKTRRPEKPAGPGKPCQKLSCSRGVYSRPETSPLHCSK
jgi:hypothetical protein